MCFVCRATKNDLIVDQNVEGKSWRNYWNNCQYCDDKKNIHFSINIHNPLNYDLLCLIIKIMKFLTHSLQTQNLSEVLYHKNSPEMYQTDFHSFVWNGIVLFISFLCSQFIVLLFLYLYVAIPECLFILILTYHVNSAVAIVITFMFKTKHIRWH